ncbi:MAG: phosphopentomutase [Candidatus Coatesbacteria bacterium 4484_99]|uniref:Phosphopentomutase n=1 Tax=Candidatus Coatesbacteria bacterium 4484_99 TaxID=1970774 RepID=A0A1W9S1U2_9BACT|nr:MAG: phosphopentomutase [Candidatus Coatesbacteria bacterium 4484_99]
MEFRRVILIILDGVGVGEMPDAGKYGDCGSATFQNTYRANGGLKIKNMLSLGMGRITGIERDYPVEGAFGKSAIASEGKDSTTGHWEIAGVITREPFPTFPDGFPDELISEFERLTCRKVIGNKPASGTEIIKELGEKHLKTGALIVYTSADSVFQIAAHEDVVPVEKLYEYCRIAREICRDDYRVGRVIARPFKGKVGEFYRTERRRDFSVPAPDGIVLDSLIKAGRMVLGVGKVDYIFGGRGFTECVHTKDNNDGMKQILNSMKRLSEGGMIFSNLVDFDMRWGHRNNYEAFGRGLEDFDRFIPTLKDNTVDGDIVIITADHGNDPTTISTDHTREYVPIMIWHRQIEGSVEIGLRHTMADIGQTVADVLGVEKTPDGNSFKEMLI